MMGKLNQLLDRWANWKTIVIVILIALPFNLYLFPMRSAKLRELSGLTDPIIDVKFTHTPEQIYPMIKAYGEQGRPLYAVTELTVDLIYPILYNLLLCSILTIVWRQALLSDDAVHKMQYLPLATCLADYAENISLAILLVSYPQELTAIAWAASFFTTAKWVLGGASFILIVVGLIAWLVKAIAKRQSA